MSHQQGLEPYDNSIDQELCRMYEGFYYYQVYDENGAAQGWELWENCDIHLTPCGMTYIIKKEA